MLVVGNHLNPCVVYLNPYDTNVKTVANGVCSPPSGSDAGASGGDAGGGKMKSENKSGSAAAAAAKPY